MFDQPSQVQFSLPVWLQEYAKTYESSVSIEDRMQFVINASQKNIEYRTGGPFAAAVFECETGELVSIGVNLVTQQNLSILHAEMVALTLAQRKLATFDLGGKGLAAYELVSSTEPCAMCLGAIPWSGVKRTVTAAHDSDAREIGFDEGPKINNWQAALRERGIEVISNIKRDEARQVLQNYLQEGGTIYNSRESGA